MAELVREFTKQGLQRFEDAIRQSENGDLEFLIPEILFESANSIPITDTVTVDTGVFRNKLEAAKYLSEKVSSLGIADWFHRRELWAWLSAFYIDSVCPRQPDGTRKVGEPYRYVPPPDRSWRTYYRHLLAFPVRVFHKYSHNELILNLLLHGSVDRLGDLIEQLASRQEILMNEGVLEAAGLLYWNFDKGAPKRGSRPSKEEAGTLRRFIHVVSQLDLTYDLQSMTGEQILQLLPRREFEQWMPQ